MDVVLSQTYQGTALEPLNKLINILNFNNGTYSDYTSVFTNPKLAFNEEDFNNFRKNPDKSSFKYGANSAEEIMSHVKPVAQDSKLVTLYYLEDINKTDESKALMQWRVENREGKWLLKND